MAYAQLSYDPWETPPQERKARFVGRENLLRQILSAIAEQQDYGSLQHYLLLGPRGIGKTTLLLTLGERIRENPELSTRWLCVQLREEEYFVRTLRDLLELMLGALAEEEELPDAAEVVQRMREERQQERSVAIAMDGLRSLVAARGKRILLLVDNFDRLFPATASGRKKSGSPDNEFRSLRKLLSTEKFLMVVGASVRLFEEIASYDRAFFNFFLPVEIPNLDDDEICELLRRCAEIEGNTTFLAQFDAMRDKVRAITYMTGGNPRLVLMLYDVLRHAEMIPVVRALRETVGGLTPLLKHVLDDMPRQQSKTLDALVRLRGAASPNEIARLSRLPLNVVTVQLGRLKDTRFVVGEGEGKGRPARYRVSDPMFHTWYQTRYLRPAGRRIELFVEFIRAWFSLEERKRLLEDRWRDVGNVRRQISQESSLAIQYFASALDDERERQYHVGRLADVFVEAGRELDAAMLLAESAEPMTLMAERYDSAGYRLLGDRMVEKGSVREAITAFSKALKKEPRNVPAALNLGRCFGLLGEFERAAQELQRVLDQPCLLPEQIAEALFFRGLAKASLGDNQGAIADYTAVIDLPDAPTAGVAMALVKRGVAKSTLGDSHGEIADYTAVIDLPAAPAKENANALYNRGVLRSPSDCQAAIADFAAVIDLSGSPVELVAKALFNRALVKGSLGDTEGTVADYMAVVNLTGAPAEPVAKALFNSGVTKGSLGDSQGAIADYTAVIKVPDAPVALIAVALFNRGAMKRSLGDRQGEIADYTTVIDLPNALVEPVADALINRGVAKASLGDNQGAISDYTAVIDLPEAPVKSVAKALVNRGIEKGSLDDRQGAIADYTAVIDLSGAPVEAVAKALLKRGVAKGSLGGLQEEITDYTAVIDLSDAPIEQVAKALFNRGVAKASLNDSWGAIADYTTVIDLSDAPVEQVGNALFNRGVEKGSLGDRPGAIADYTAVIHLPGARVEQVAMSLVNRSSAKGYLGDSQGAIADCTAVIDLPGATDEQVVKALINRGTAFGNMGEAGKALSDFQQTTTVPGVTAQQKATALHNSGTALAMLDMSTEAVACFEQCLELKADAESVHAAFARLIFTHLRGVRPEEAARCMSGLHEYEPAETPLERRLEVRINTIVTAAKDHTPETAALLLDAALKSDPEEIRARLEFLAPAIQYAQTGDEKALSPLPEHERDAAREIAAVITGHKV
jgi:tetratricopeptide (TPR) repeat protein